MTVDESQLKERYEKAGQSHVLNYLSDLSTSDKESLLQELDAIQIEDLAGLLESALAEQNILGTEDPITPFSQHVGRSTDKGETDAAYKIGMDAISRGEVAALVLAGGQGTRLGFSGPKGMYDIGLPSGRTLFQMISERLLRLRKLAAAGGVVEGKMPSLPFYIMTSPINHEDTTAFFEAHSFFGLPREDVHLFEQGMLPCLTTEGKIIMETASKVAMAPDGNGGIYPSLHNSGMLADMSKRGIKYLHVFSIDNALTKPADPVFIGYCISQEADCGNKVVWKASAHEKVGVIAEKGGKSCVVEYSDITTEMAERTDGDGRLCFGAGNICNHFYTLDFLENSVLPNLGNMYHIARKKIPFYDEKTKETVKPEGNNGLKLESFIFDVFPLSKKMAVLDVLREEEFAPVKNAPGSPSDSPDTARAYLSALAKKWVGEAGGIFKGDTESTCEVGPLTSYGGEGLEDLVKEKEVVCPFSL
jgi:UDP-N-acetylglucosamine/UDP-N-acetylgalactosamine diphosphorylase